MSQKEKICAAINSYIADKGLKFDGKIDLTTEQRGHVTSILVELFKQGVVEIKSDKERPNPKKYFAGAVSNYLRKDPQYNNGNKYAPDPDKLKGPRKSKKIQEMEKLLAAVSLGSDAEVIKQVQAELDTMITEAATTKVVTIDIEHIPESLRHLIK